MSNSNPKMFVSRNGSNEFSEYFNFKMEISCNTICIFVEIWGNQFKTIMEMRRYTRHYDLTIPGTISILTVRNATLKRYCIDLHVFKVALKICKKYADRIQSDQLIIHWAKLSNELTSWWYKLICTQVICVGC